MYEVDEETKEIKLGEEAPDTSAAALNSTEAWCHYNPAILSTQGRCTYAVEPAEGDDIAEKDPQIDRFRALVEDTPVAKYTEEL